MNKTQKMLDEANNRNTKGQENLEKHLKNLTLQEKEHYEKIIAYINRYRRVSLALNNLSIEELQFLLNECNLRRWGSAVKWFEDYYKLLLETKYYVNEGGFCDNPKYHCQGLDKIKKLPPGSARKNQREWEEPFL